MSNAQLEYEMGMLEMESELDYMLLQKSPTDMALAEQVMNRIDLRQVRRKNLISHVDTQYQELLNNMQQVLQEMSGMLSEVGA